MKKKNPCGLAGVEMSSVDDSQAHNHLPRLAQRQCIPVAAGIERVMRIAFLSIGPQDRKMGCWSL
jgi:hypothetical protein